MAYDSATAVQEASNAYKRAVAAASAQRAQIESNYGLNDDGTLNNTAAGQLGSIYQTNLSSVNNETAAESADLRRGFGSSGGIGAKNRTAAHKLGLTNQALQFKSATGDLAANTAENQQAGQDYRDQVGDDGTGGIIGRNAAWDLAHTLTDTPVEGKDVPQVPQIAPGVPAPTFTQNPSYSYSQLYKSNPKKYQTIKGKF